MLGSNCYLGFPFGSDGKESVFDAGDLGSVPRSGRFPWRREWQPIPVFLPGEFHGQSCVVGYSPWGCKESDMTDQLTFSLSLLYIKYFNNEDLLYSTGNSTQYLVITYNGKESEKE